MEGWILGLGGGVLGFVLGFWISHLRSKVATTQLETRLEETQRAVAEKLQLVERSKEELGNLFKGLSNDALKSNNDHFLKLAREVLENHQNLAKADFDKRSTSIDELLKPMKEQLQEVNKRNENIDKTLALSHNELKTQIQGLQQTHIALNERTHTLVNALRRPQARGRWGEMMLERVAEIAGLKEGINFTLQEHRSTEDGALRPDMVVTMPGGRTLVIDAKTSLEAYLTAHEAADEAQRELELDRHAQQLRTHMTGLSRKAYWAQFENTPEFVVMFVPGENFFSAALDRDPALLEDAMRNNVVLATPTTLISLLKTVSLGWRQEALAENARRISDLGRELHDRLSKVAEELGAVGKNLERATGSYNKAVRSLESRVFPSARRFKELGIDSAKSLPELEPLDQTPQLPEGVKPEEE